MTTNSSNRVNKPDSEMLPLQRNLFFTGMTTPASLYLRLGPQSYLLIAREQERISLEDFHVLQNPQSLVYVDKLSYEKLARYLVLKTSQFIDSEALPLNIKAGLVESLTENAVSALTRTQMIDTLSLKSAVTLILQLSKKVPHFNDVLDRVERFPLTRTQHGMNTALLSLMIAQEMKISLPTAHEKLVIGSLLMDLGLDQVPQEILEKPKQSRTKEEDEIYQKHPLYGVEMVKDLKDISQDILLIIEESHENSRGSGFPRQIRDVRISPLGKIVGLANQVLELITEISTEAHEKSPVDRAINIIETELNQPFNKDCFLALKNLVNKAYFAKKKRGQI